MNRVLSRVGLALVLLAATVRPARAQELMCSVAISMKDAVEELGGRFSRLHPRVTLRYNFGSSGELQQQIEAGAPADIFISAAEGQMDALDRKGLVRPGTRRVFARNLLTVIVPADSRLALRAPRDLLDPRVQKIVIGNPRTVPAGQYSEASLRTLGLSDRLRTRLVYAENVRQALEYVSRGEVEAGFVYVTDAMTRAGRVREAFRPPADSYPPVLYPAAVLRDAAQPALAQAFLDLLARPEGRAVLARLGFQPPGDAAR